jgi:hypothetical protein
LLRREQPKLCAARRVASPAAALFEECSNAIQQDVIDRASKATGEEAVKAPEQIPADRIGTSGVIDEAALHHFLLRSHQAFDQQMPWDQQNEATMLPAQECFDTFDMDDIDELLVRQGKANTFSATEQFDVLDIMSMLQTTQNPHCTSAGNAESFNNNKDEDESTAIQQSLATWRKQTSTAPPLKRSLIDTTTFLIDYWFRDICPMWSAYDSNQNPNRILMSKIWTNSKAVLFSMKTMAATCLIPTLPHLRSEATSSARGAVEAIQEDLGNLQLSQHGTKPTVPLDLFLALLCVGTTMCWLDTNLLGLAYWKEARRLRDHYHSIYWLLDEEEQQKLTFFENSCVYWDMLAAVVSNESPDTSMIEDTMFGCAPPSDLIKPHPWTGVAYKQQRLLSRTIALCRRHRLKVRENASAGEADPSQPAAAAEDLMDAYMISNELEIMDMPLAHSILDTGDRTSLQIHFALLANAFRIASLLQLHQTFQLDASSFLEPISQKRLVLKLALELVKILEDIPVWSNTRCTQPILYITAASGLRFETPPGRGQDLFSALTPELLEVHRARRFILDRFAALQRSLPPKPIIVATELVQAVWRKYESERSDVLDVHWIDVMIDGRLSTLFG